MSLDHDLLLDAWREACQHIDIAESAATIAAALAQRTPIAQIVIRRLDLQRAWLETVVTHAAAGVPPRVPARTELSPEQLKLLVAWCAENRVARRSDRHTRAVFALLAPAGLQSQALAGPLQGSEGPAGVLIALARRSAQLDARHESLLAALLEPFSAALENDRRLHEMKALREAAEADRRSLLTRLGRRELSAPIVGTQAGLRHVMERVDSVCRSDVPVLLLGETGTGKEVIARAIHDRSPRHAGPFIRVNCGAIPSELMDSQLFGHERGSFTGAVDTHQGWFERADTGTLLLDEIGELPPPAQVRLLRVLQDGFIERVGGKHSIHVDVRIVAATHRDLAAMVRDGRFREDLLYRIAVFPISIPPLRDRLEDIPALAFHFAEKASTRFGLRLVMPDADALRVLTAYAWPGNVRELAAVIDRAALLGNGRGLEITKALGVGLSGKSTPSPAAESAGTPQSASQPARAHGAAAGTAPQGLDDVMRAHIESALQACYGRIEGRFGAAARLNVNANTLRARMRRMGIDWRKFRA